MIATASPLERALADDRSGSALRCIALEQHEHWLGEAVRPLRALFAPDRGARALVLTDDVAGADALDGAVLDPETAAARLRAPLLDAGAPVPLVAHAEPKPWGRELWFTGIERRGVSRVRGAGAELSVPLPWLLTALPGRFGGVRSPVLLKILDPHADERLGELYLEMHETKQEVYVVTHVDADAWPGGRGAIRMGVDAARIAELGDAGVRRAFLDAVRTYEAVRRRIDAHLDGFRDAEGIARDAVVAPQRQHAWNERLPMALVAEERTLRERVTAFTRSESLSSGDVVRVPRRVPHALRHGVRVVEFQTPVYERRILFFAQKVLTQDHWDTAEAVEHMALRPPPAAPLPVAVDDRGVRAEWIVEFDDFRVLRLRLEPGTRCPLPRAPFGVLMGVDGTAQLGATTLAAEQAALIPGTALGDGLRAGPAGAVALLALPPADASDPGERNAHE